MMKILFVVFLAVPVAVNAWMDQWAPSFECVPAKVRELPKHSVAGYVKEAHEGGEFVAEYSSGGALDLNGDGIEDFIFIIPWMGNGLSASGDDVHFLVSNGKNGRMATIFYENAKFRRVSLTPADLKAIAKETTPTSKKYP